MTSGERKLNDLIKDGNRFDFLKEYCQQNGLDPDNEDHLAKASRAWNAGKKMSTKEVQDNTPDSIGGENMPTGIGDFIRKSVQSQYAENKDMMGGEAFNVESIGNILFSKDNKVKGVAQIATDLAKNMGEQVILYLRQQNDLLEKMGQKTGILGNLSVGFRNEISKASVDAIKLGVSFTELSDVITSIVAESGKFKLLDEDTMSQMVAVSKFSQNLATYGRLVPIFEKVGLGVGDMNREIEKAGRSAMGLGLNARSVVSLIGENLDKLNQYGFKNGVQGMKEMAQKSIEFRMNMSDTFALAEKVWSPEKALDVVSNLQVIGGAFGDMNDPIKLMWMATNNVEGLQTALQETTKTLATYNVEQGRFEVTGANLRRAHEMAETLGVDMKELTNGAVAAMERTQAASDLMAQGLQLKPEQTEFLTNLARMEGGQMVISIPENLRAQLGLEGEQKNVALNTLSQTQADMLIREQDALKDKTMTEIANEQVSLIENINRDLSYLVAMVRVQGGETGRRLAERYLHYDPLAITKELGKVTEDFGGYIKTHMSDLNNKIEAGGVRYGKQTGTVNAGATATTVKNVTKESAEPIVAASNTTTKQEVTHKFQFTATDATIDPIRRAFMAEHATFEAAKDSFLEKPVKK